MYTYEIVKSKSTTNRQSWWNPEVKPVIIPELKVGDLIYYKYQGSPINIDSAICNIVIAIESDLIKCKKNYIGMETPYLLMALTETSNYNRNTENSFKTDPWVRWTDGLNLHILTEEQKAGILDDFVQNYIQKHTPLAHTYLK